MISIISCSKFDLIEVLSGVIDKSFRAIDCRIVTNPHHEKALRELTGKDQPVVDELLAYPLFQDLKDRIVSDGAAGEYKFLVTWCFGGRHRSVAMAELVAVGLITRGIRVTVEHLTLKRRGLA